MNGSSSAQRTLLQREQAPHQGLRGFPGPLEAELLHPAAERAGIHVKQPRCATLAFDHPVCLR